MNVNCPHGPHPNPLFMSLHLVDLVDDWLWGFLGSRTRPGGLMHMLSHTVSCHWLICRLVFSARPEEYKARQEQRHKAKNEVLGHSKQGEFIKLMEQEVERHNTMKQHSQSPNTSLVFTLDCLQCSFKCPQSFADTPGRHCWRRHKDRHLE